MFNKVANDVFDQIMLPNWKTSASLSIAPRPWLKTFIKVAKETNVISVKLATQLASSASLLRIMLNTFQVDKSFPSAREFAINIAFEIDQRGFSINVQDIPELWRLKSFAASVRMKWLKTIQHNFVLNTKFINLFAISPASIKCDLQASSVLLDEKLCHRDKLAKEYFSYFSVKAATDNITVWLSNHTNIMAFNSCATIVVPVVIDSNNGVELGFFRDAYEYSININEQQSWLQESSLDRVKARESAVFDNASFGLKSSHVIWRKTAQQSYQAA